MRVLVVDDDAPSLSALSALLRDDGIEAVAFERAAEALEAMRSEHFDAVVTDLRMPVVDGAQVVRTARLTQSGAPVFMLSNTGAESERAGADVVLTKPINYGQLLELLRPSVR
jgi:DNA-binding response OmpR family regulator